MKETIESANSAPLTAEQFFPMWREDIRRLRARSPSFEELCCDLEVMARLLRSEGPGDGAVVESIEGLKDEIRHAVMFGTGNT